MQGRENECTLVHPQACGLLGCPVLSEQAPPPLSSLLPYVVGLSPPTPTCKLSWSRLCGVCLSSQAPPSPRVLSLRDLPLLAIPPPPLSPDCPVLTPHLAVFSSFHSPPLPAPSLPRVPRLLLSPTLNPLLSSAPFPPIRTNPLRSPPPLSHPIPSLPSPFSAFPIHRHHPPLVCLTHPFTSSPSPTPIQNGCTTAQ